VVVLTETGAPVRITSAERQALRHGMDKKRRQGDRRVDVDPAPFRADDSEG
jgi:hypothetical protein